MAFVDGSTFSLIGILMDRIVRDATPYRRRVWRACASAPRATGLALCLTALALFAAPRVCAETVTYRLTVDNTWSELTHPGAFPPDAHFSWLGGATHSSAVSIWNDGELASPGVVQMAETGATTILMGEVSSAVTAGAAGGALNWMHWFCPSGTTHSSCGSLVVEFEVDDAFPLVTLVSMLGPSPDWFVGVSGLPLHDGTGWLNTVVVDLFPYDGGTREQNLFSLFGPLTSPPDPVSLITTMSGQLVGPGTLGTFTFERLGIEFVRGDVNADGSFNIADAVASLAALFSGAGPLTCDDAADLNDDGAVDVADPVSALASLFSAAPSPVTPFPDCGLDATADPLSCDSFSSCP